MSWQETGELEGRDEEEIEGLSQGAGWPQSNWICE